MAFVPLAAPVDLAITTTGSWVDADISGQTGYSADVVGVELLIVVTGSSNRNIGVRKNGSTDNRTGLLLGYPGGTLVGARIGVDSSGIFEAYVSDVDTDVYLVGFYESDDAVFFTNGVDKSQNTTGSWVDTDISSNTGGDTAIAAFFEYSTSANLIGMLRPNGSTDSRLTYNTGVHNFLVTGVDGSEICEQYINNSAVDFILNGYLTGGGTFHTNATNRSTATTGSYVDITALPAGATAGVYDCWNQSSVPTRYGLRTGGTSYDIYRGPYLRAHHVVPCDGSGVVQQKIAGTDADLYELGYLSTAGGTDYDLAVDQSTVTITGQAVGTRVGRKVTASASSVSVTGSSVGLRVGHRLALSAATVAVTGQALTTRATRALGVSPATTTVTGASVGLRRGWRLALGAATVAVTGQAVAVTPGRRLGLSAASVSVTGAIAATRATRRVTLDAATVAVAGQDVALTALGGYTLGLDAATVSATGQAVTLSATRRLTTDAAALVVTGAAVTLSRGYRLALGSATVSLAAASVTPRAGRALAVSPASVTTTGAAVSVRTDRRLATDPSSVVVQAQEVGLGKTGNYALALDPSTVTVSAHAVTVVAARVLSHGAATVTATGQAVTGVVSRRLALDALTLTLTGAAVSFQGEGPSVSAVTLTGSARDAIALQGSVAAVALTGSATTHVGLSGSFH